MEEECAEKLDRMQTKFNKEAEQWQGEMDQANNNLKQMQDIVSALQAEKMQLEQRVTSEQGN